MDLPTPLREWTRDEENRKIAGVCGGIAKALGVPVTPVRAAFVLLSLPGFSGMGVALYLAFWFLMPSRDGDSGLDHVVDLVTGLTGEPGGRAETRASRDRKVRSELDALD